MPSVIFFGGTVPQQTKDRSIKMVGECEQLLIVGSSVTVYSSYRLCKEAFVQGKAVAAVNIGETRADDLLDFKVEARVGDTLSKLVQALTHSN